MFIETIINNDRRSDYLQMMYKLYVHHHTIVWGTCWHYAFSIRSPADFDDILIYMFDAIEHVINNYVHN